MHQQPVDESNHPYWPEKACAGSVVMHIWDATISEGLRRYAALLALEGARTVLEETSDVTKAAANRSDCQRLS